MYSWGMDRAITVYEAKTHLSKVLDDVEAGSAYVVTRNGTPCARIVPLGKPKRIPLGFVKGRVTSAFFEALPEAELAAWEGVEPVQPKRRQKKKRFA
jgi:prevent-host-death family protein